MLFDPLIGLRTRAVVHRQFMTGFREMPRHRVSHHAKPYPRQFHSSLSNVGRKTGLAEDDGITGRRREAQVATLDHRFAAAVFLEQLRLTALGARIDFRRIANPVEALAAFGERVEIVGHMDKPTPEHIPPGTAADVQVLISTGSVGCTDAMMAAMPRLSLVCCYGTGYERIDLAAARKRNVMVTHGADANAPDVAEMAMAILLASTRRIVRADKMIRRGEWTKRIPNRFGAIAGLSGGKLGILGLGAIGLEIAKRAKGFDLEIG